MRPYSHVSSSYICHEIAFAVFELDLLCLPFSYVFVLNSRCTDKKFWRQIYIEWMVACDRRGPWKHNNFILNASSNMKYLQMLPLFCWLLRHFSGCLQIYGGIFIQKGNKYSHLNLLHFVAIFPDLLLVSFWWECKFDWIFHLCRSKVRSPFSLFCIWSVFFIHLVFQRTKSFGLFAQNQGIEEKKGCV